MDTSDRPIATSVLAGIAREENWGPSGYRPRASPSFCRRCSDCAANHGEIIFRIINGDVRMARSGPADLGLRCFRRALLDHAQFRNAAMMARNTSSA